MNDKILPEFDLDKTANTLGDEIAKLVIEKLIKQDALAPVIHAHWIDCNGKAVELDSNGCPKDSCWCSRCHEWLVASDEYNVVGKYCPNCGAKMDERS